MKLIWTLLCAAAMLVCGGADDAFPAFRPDAPPPMAEKAAEIVRMFTPLYKKNSVTEETVRFNGTVPIRVARVILSGDPVRLLMTGAKKSETAKLKPEYIDVLIVPAGKTSPFALNTALSLREEKVGKGDENLFFHQYGFAWRRLTCGLKRFTEYLGRDAHYYYFASSNLPALLKLREGLKLNGGFDEPSALASALRVRDAGDVTAETASLQLPKYGNDALPYLMREIRETTALDEPVYPHFRVLVRIATPEALQVVNRFAASDDRKILLPLYDAIMSARLADPALEPCYFSMIRNQIGLPYVIDAYEKMNRKKNLEPALRAVMLQAYSYDNYALAALTLIKWRDPNRKTVHASAEKDIRLLLIRGGEAPDSVQYLNPNEAAATRERRLSAEDEKRIKPTLDLLAAAPERELTVLTGLNLALSSTRQVRVSPQYIARLRRTGIRILKMHPEERGKIDALLRTLIENGKNPKEVELLRQTRDAFGAHR